MRRHAGLRLAGGLFYAAPIGAGLTNAGYVAVLPFAGLFFLWVLIMRHRPFRDGPGFVLPVIMLHLAIASMLLGFGHLLRALLGVEVTVPLPAWLALGLAALLLGRLIWTPREEAEIETVLEKAMRALDRFADDAEEIRDTDPDLPLAHPTAAEASALAAANGALDALPPEGGGTETLRPIVMAADREVRGMILWEALRRRAGRTGARRDRAALLVAASDIRLARRATGERRMAEAFDLIVEAADTSALIRFLPVAADLLETDPMLAADLPEVARLVDIAGQIEQDHPELSDGLVQLANRIEDLDRDSPDE